MLDLSYKYLHWTPPLENTLLPSGPVDSSSSSLWREYIITPTGRLEVLCTHPPSSPAASAPPTRRSSRTRRRKTSWDQPDPDSETDVGSDDEGAPPAVVFVHGGMGSASVWSEYMHFFAAHNIRCYALSLRGHGNSWHPSYLRMTFLTTRHMLATDVAAAVRWAQARQNGANVVLVAHSSGAGLAQHLLSRKMVGDVRGLAMLGGVPAFGSSTVYGNWLALDPLSVLRMLLHGGHPNSLLSTPRLVKQAFFSDAFPIARVVEWMSERASRYESLLWPTSMLRPFADPGAIIRALWGKDVKIAGDRILVLHGTEDRLMTTRVMKRLAGVYRATVSALVDQGDAKIPSPKHATVNEIEGEGDHDTAGLGVRYCIVPGAGHHVQNDLQWEVGAAKVYDFYRQLQ